jgi:hypothetical protein
MTLDNLPRALEYYRQQGWDILRIRCRATPRPEWTRGRAPYEDWRFLSQLPIVPDHRLHPGEYVLDATPPEGFYEHLLQQHETRTRAALRALRAPNITTHIGARASQILRDNAEVCLQRMHWMDNL